MYNIYIYIERERDIDYIIYILYIHILYIIYTLIYSTALYYIVCDVEDGGSPLAGGAPDGGSPLQQAHKSTKVYD